MMEAYDTASASSNEPVVRVWLGRGPHSPLCGASGTDRTGDYADHFDRPPPAGARPWLHGNLLVR